MTSQQQADEALSVWRANRNHPEVEAMLDQFFNEEEPKAEAGFYAEAAE